MPRKIIIWTAPRSLSTIFERPFLNHPACTVLHEPLSLPYHLGPDRRVKRFEQETEETMAQARGKLESDEVLEGREFLVIKELAYVAVEGLAGFTDDTIGSCNEPTSKLEDGLRFLRNWTNAFIIRDPAEQIPSLVHQLRRAHPDPSTYSLLHESGSGALHRLFHFVTGTLGQKAIVIEASVLRKDPKGLLKRFCAETGIEFRDDMLEWDENGGIRKGLEGWLLIVRFSQRGDPALGNLVEAWMA